MKGNILANWIYLIVFIFLYFTSISVLQSTMGSLEAIFTDFNGVNLWADIPDITWTLLNLLAYVIVPLGAIAWTILASKPQEQVGYYR